MQEQHGGRKVNSAPTSPPTITAAQAVAALAPSRAPRVLGRRRANEGRRVSK